MAGVIAQQTENKYEAIRELQNLHLDAAFTIGAEAANAINVAVQIKSDKGQAAIASRRFLQVYLATSNTGATLAAAPDGGMAIGTNGVVLGALIANRMVSVLTDASGRFDLTLTESTAKSFYMVVVMPSGRLVVSGAITFA